MELTTLRARSPGSSTDRVWASGGRYTADHGLAAFGKRHGARGTEAIPASAPVVHSSRQHQRHDGATTETLSFVCFHQRGTGGNRLVIFCPRL
jgi:hypothetical protein